MPYLGVLGSNFEKLLSYLKSVSSDLCYYKVWCKNEKYIFKTKNAWFGYFWGRIWKYYCHNWDHCPLICLIVTSCERIKYLSLGPKVSYLGIFGLEFYKTIVIFKISILKFVKTVFLTLAVLLHFGIGPAFFKGL